MTRFFINENLTNAKKNFFGKRSKEQENWAIITSGPTMVKFTFAKVRNTIQLL